MNIKRSTLIVSTIVVLIAVSIPVFSSANVITDFIASLFRLASSTPQTTISKFALCRELASTNAKDVFVPLNSESEWNDFINNPPPQTTLNACGTNCAKIPVSILLTSNTYDVTQEHFPGATNSGPGGQGNTTLSFNWSEGGVMQPLLASAPDYDPNAWVVPFNISAVITFSDGTTDNVSNIAPPDGKWHQLPGDWSLISSTNPRNMCAQGYDIDFDSSHGYEYSNFINTWSNLNPSGWYPVLRRFTDVSNCENFIGSPGYGDYTIGNEPYDSDYFFGQIFSISGLSDSALSSFLNSRTTSLYSADGSALNGQMGSGTPLGGNPLMLDPTRLVTFNYKTPDAYNACTNLINCHTDKIPVRVLFGTVSNTIGDGGANATFNWLTGQVTAGNAGGANFGPLDISATVTFSDGTSVVDNSPQSGQNFQLDGDWSTSAGILGYVPGNLVWGIGGSSPSKDGGSSASVNYSANTTTFQVSSSGSGDTSGPGYAGYQVYIKHTANVNAQCIDENGSIDHKTETADYSFNTSAFTSSQYETSPGFGGWYQFYTSILGFWGSSSINIPGYAIGQGWNNTHGSFGAIYLPPDFSGTPPGDDESYPTFNGIYNNTFDPDIVGDWTASTDPCFAILDVVQQQCNVLTANTPYANAVLPTLMVSSTPAPQNVQTAGCLIASNLYQPGGIYTGSGFPLDDYDNTYNASPSNPYTTNITYSCVDPRDVVSHPYGIY